VICLRKHLAGAVGTVVGHDSGKVEVELALTPKIRAEEERFGERVAKAALHGEVSDTNVYGP